MWHRQVVSTCYWKNDLIDLLETGLPEIFNLFKKKRRKKGSICESQYACIIWVYRIVLSHQDGLKILNH